VGPGALILITAGYVVIALDLLIKRGDPGGGITFLGYAFANVGLYWKLFL
jgi:hypothetical protein